MEEVIMYKLANRSGSVSSLLDEVDNVFGRPFGFPAISKTVVPFVRSANTFYEVEETDSEIVAKINIPKFNGDFSKEDISVTLEDDNLSVKVKNLRTEERENNFISRSLREASFEMSVSSSKYKINKNDLEAILHDNGILEIKMPKIADENKKSIEVKVKR